MLAGWGLFCCIALYGAIMGHLIRRILRLMAATFVHGLRPAAFTPRPNRTEECQRAWPVRRSLAFHWRDYPYEFSGALIFIVVPLGASGSTALAGGLIFSWFLLALSWIDYHTLLLPDKLTVPMLLCGLAGHVLGWSGPGAFYDGLLGAMAGGGMLWLLQHLFFRIKGYQGLGGGDIKLLAALGAWLGWRALPGLCCGAALCGLAIFAMADRTRREVPFGPCLALAGWVIHLNP